MTAPPAAAPPPAEPHWLRLVWTPAMAGCLATGFASGLPLYVGAQLIPAWARSTGVDLTTIGLLGLAGLPYTWKFLWAPVLDATDPVGWGRRRSWAAICQAGLLLSIGALSLIELDGGAGATWALGGLALLIALLSATQDVALDAWRRELLPDRSLGLGNSLFVNAYRISSLVPGSLALILADRLPWPAVHLIVAAFMVVGLAATALLPEPALLPAPAVAPVAPGSRAGGAQGLERLRAPLVAFFTRHGRSGALRILAFMLLYKLGDSMATALLTPFYIDTGFSLSQIGTIAKAASLWAVVLGSTVGGLLMLKVGVNRGLWLFGGLQLVSIFGLLALALIGPDPAALFVAVSLEYLGVGMGTSAFVAFIARSTDRAHTATQLALLSSLVGVPRTLATAGAGALVEQLGYPVFFGLCALLALPGMWMLRSVAPWGDDPAAPTPGGA